MTGLPVPDLIATDEGAIPVFSYSDFAEASICVDAEPVSPVRIAGHLLACDGRMNYCSASAARSVTQ
jgi:hypothetical protein